MVFVSRHSKPFAREVLIAGGMSLCSIGIQLSVAHALEDNIPGHIVYPVVTGSNLFIVAAAGVILFKERIGRYGIAGMILGMVSLLILSLS
jgi:multidrug transporter EmrE-like cation transporter